MFNIWHWLREKIGVERDRIYAIHRHDTLHGEVMLVETQLRNLEQILLDMRREARLLGREVTRLTLELERELNAAEEQT